MFMRSLEPPNSFWGVFDAVDRVKAKRGTRIWPAGLSWQPQLVVGAGVVLTKVL